MMYLKYLRYVLLHKWYVGIECWNRMLYWRGLKHDWSKFLPSEFIAYAEFFYGPNYDAAFDVAWLNHQHRNDHHWQHWVLREDSGETKILQMPYRCMLEMVCDWIGAGRAINPHERYDLSDPFRETRKWYLRNEANILLHPETRKQVHLELCMYKERQEAAQVIT